jgi:hypothetical protein
MARQFQSDLTAKQPTTTTVAAETAEPYDRSMLSMSPQLGLRPEMLVNGGTPHGARGANGT